MFNIYSYLNINLAFRYAVETSDTAAIQKCVGKVNLNEGLLISDSIKTTLDLVNAGASIGYMNNILLFKAIESGKIGHVISLVDHGANPRARRDLALSLAIVHKYLKIAKYLLEKGCKPKFDHAHSLIEHDSSFIVILIQYGLNIHAYDDSLLYLACKYGHVNLVSYLVQKGANVRAQNDDAVKIAADNKHHEIVNYLLKNSARELSLPRYYRKKYLPHDNNESPIEIVENENQNMMFHLKIPA